VVIDPASSGPDAWFAGDTQDYAIVVLDLGLPRLDGLTILKRWRVAGRNFRVLILSARGDWTKKVEGRASTISPVLVQPLPSRACQSFLRAEPPTASFQRFRK
jgi:DNA-binding response OmpR family regulator